MPKPSKQPLQPNPFQTYRDPETGMWVVEKNIRQENSQFETAVATVERKSF